MPSASRQASHESQNQPPMMSISPPSGLAGATSLRNILAAKSSTLDLSRIEWLYGKKVSVGGGGGSNCQLHVSLRSKIPADSPMSFGESEALALLRLLFVEDIQEFLKAQEEKCEQQPLAVRDTWNCKLAPKRKNILQLVRLVRSLYYKSRIYFCAHHFCPKRKNVRLFSSLLPHFDKCHETSRIFLSTEQTFASARSFGVIS